MRAATVLFVQEAGNKRTPGSRRSRRRYAVVGKMGTCVARDSDCCRIAAHNERHDPVELRRGQVLRVDAILVLGGGAPRARRPATVRRRAVAAAALWKAAAKKPKILNTVGGHGPRPQLLDARGSVVFEAAASAAVIINEGVDAADVFLETASFDTIGNARSTRGTYCSRRAGGTSHHVGLPPRPHEGDLRLGLRGRRRGAVPGLRASYLGTEDGPDAGRGLGAARRQDAVDAERRVEPGAGYRKLASVRQISDDATRPLFREKVVGPGREARRRRESRRVGRPLRRRTVPRLAASHGATTPAVSPGAATPAKPVCPPCEAATPAACGCGSWPVLVAFAVGAFLGVDRGLTAIAHYRTDHATNQ